MPIWRVSAVSEQPEILLCSWTVYETERGERHFVGKNMEEGTGRVSSAIANYDVLSKTGTTRSGRRYVLHGGPGIDDNAAHTWEVWKIVNKVTLVINVSAEYCAVPSESAS